MKPRLRIVIISIVGAIVVIIALALVVPNFLVQTSGFGSCAEEDQPTSDAGCEVP